MIKDTNLYPDTVMGEVGPFEISGFCGEKFKNDDDEAEKVFEAMVEDADKDISSDPVMSVFLRFKSL